MTTDDAGSAAEADAGSSCVPTEPAPPEPKSPVTPRPGRSSRAAWRGWRRSRPFWGGLLLVLAGLELLALPLTGVFVHGAIKLVIYIGIGGVFGVLIGALLIVAGISAWVNPTHRVFYGIAGIVLGIISFPASNLGGFLLGMLLAIIGGALAFAWVPADPESVAAAPAGRVGDDVGDPAGHRMLAVAAMPAVLVAGLLGTGGAAKAAPSPQDGGNCILGIVCLPTPTPTPSASASASASATPSPATSSPTPSATPSSGPSVSPSPSASPSGTASPSPTPTPSASVSASPSASGTGSSKPAGSQGSKVTRKDAAAPSDLTASAAASVLSAGSATLTNFNYQGIVSMPVSGGGSEQMLEFTASSAALSGGVTVSVTQGGLTTDTSSPTLGFSDGLTLYATELCGNIYGVLPKCFTPSTSSAILLSLANLLSGITPITMTDVTTEQPLATSGELQTGSLTVGF